MPILDSKNRNGIQKPYGVMFDEAKLMEIFSKISELEGAAQTESTEVAFSEAKTAMKQQLELQSAQATSLANSYVTLFSKAEQGAAGGGAIDLMADRAGSYGYSPIYDYRPLNTSLDAGYKAFIEVLTKLGFSSSTLSAAQTAVNVLSKYTLWTFRSINHQRGIVEYLVTAETNPKTRAVARAISANLFALLKNVTADDYWQVLYPNIPNPKSPTFATAFDTYFNATYKP